MPPQKPGPPPDPEQSQEMSIQARKNLFELPSEVRPVVRKPFSVYLRETPAAPLPRLIQATLWAAGVLVVLLFLVVLIRGILNLGESQPSRPIPPRAALAPRPGGVPLVLLIPKDESRRP